jgi:alkyl sulfatase BDS1-like metallo-beta-lactamase superfamily hydrolase
MREHPLDLSARMIESGVVDTPPNRVDQVLSELGDGIALVESFSHVLLVDSGDGLVAFDASGSRSGREVVESIRRWSTDRVHTIVYTHGHLDHVGGSPAFAADAAGRGVASPRVIGNHRIVDRFERYEQTSGYNQIINLRQFGGAAKALATAVDAPFLPAATLRPDVVYEDRLADRVGDVDLDLHACMGETDDHTWTWIPGRRVISAGDQFIWNFPNCGNPQKVQRYPGEWARSLRDMAAMDAELFVPAHGLPIAGGDRIRTCLETVAGTLETLLGEVIAAMNAGATLDEILHSVSVPDATLAIPYLRPMYDEPEFVIRNIWRLYGGWWDGNPARLKPASDAAIGTEVVGLVGSIDRLLSRSLELSEAGDHRLACQLIEFAAGAEPDSPAVHEARTAIYTARRSAETSLMAKGIYKAAAADSQTVLTGAPPPLNLVLTIGES